MSGRTLVIVSLIMLFCVMAPVFSPPYDLGDSGRKVESSNCACDEELKTIAMALRRQWDEMQKIRKLLQKEQGNAVPGDSVNIDSEFDSGSGDFNP